MTVGDLSLRLTESEFWEWVEYAAIENEDTKARATERPKAQKR